MELVISFYYLAFHCLSKCIDVFNSVNSVSNQFQENHYHNYFRVSIHR